MQRFVERIKQRRQQNGLTRLAFTALLKLWKVARRFPLVGRITIPMRAAGHRFWIRPFSYDDLLVASPNYEGVLRRWRPEPGAIVVDAGAYIGGHTLDYARAVGPTGAVVAIEPLASNFRLLQKNVDGNRYKQVRCLNYALGERNADVQLRYSRESSTATCRQDRAAPSNQQRVQWVAQRTLDSLLEELQIETVDLIKIDVEGAELEVLKGAQRILDSEHPPTLMIETHGPVVRQAVVEWLTQRQFDIQPEQEALREFCVATKQQ